MSLAEKIALTAAGAFLLSGMLTGVWKYAKIMSSADHRAPVYVDIAHRTSFFYSFASLVLAKLIEYSPFTVSVRAAIVAVPIVFFAITVLGYIREGILDRTENMFEERSFVTTTFMYLLIAGEIGGFLLIFGGAVYSFLRG
ncbi:MAG TPA: hypothetical protein PKO33_05315 [Pyrinomonadaceae bacterium]|nr:hypothetical protein [Pyrinomonadaceae bacterium]